MTDYEESQEREERDLEASRQEWADEKNWPAWAKHVAGLRGLRADSISFNC